ncbi:hypothetical protein CPB85DRAFT_807301 [Mucidula mucida]|nr:hypothetical protein CPB85DRAFT_807301 [Mucidula mucida]
MTLISLTRGTLPLIRESTLFRVFKYRHQPYRLTRYQRRGLAARRESRRMTMFGFAFVLTTICLYLYGSPFFGLWSTRLEPGYLSIRQSLNVSAWNALGYLYQAGMAGQSDLGLTARAAILARDDSDGCRRNDHGWLYNGGKELSRDGIELIMPRISTTAGSRRAD